MIECKGFTVEKDLCKTCGYVDEDTGECLFEIEICCCYKPK